MIKKTANWLKRQAYARAIPHTRVGRDIRFSRADLEEIVRQGAQPARPRKKKAS